MKWTKPSSVPSSIDIRLRTYTERIRLYNFQNMAARFTIALVKEEYDFADNQVIDRIYWYVMFILSAHSIFDARLPTQCVSSR